MKGMKVAKGKRADQDTPQVEGATDDLILNAAETLQGDIATFLIDRMRRFPKVWAQMSEYEQNSEIESARYAAGNVIRQAVEIIAAEGRTTLKATIDKVEVKDGLKATLTLSRHDENRHELIDAVGKTVLVIVADAEVFKGGDVPKADPDQKEIPVAQAAE